MLVIADATQAWELLQLSPSNVPFFVCGPEWGHDPPGEMTPWLIEVWKTPSLQMKALCEANVIRHLHFLQPNQVAGPAPR